MNIDAVVFIGYRERLQPDFEECLVSEFWIWGTVILCQNLGNTMNSA